VRSVARQILLVALVFDGAACSPAALTPEAIVPAFIAASQDELRTMHMEWHGTAVTIDSGEPGGGAAINGVFDLNGPDYAGTMTSGAPDSFSSSVSYARVTGVSFINYSDSGWQRADVAGAAPGEVDPMIGLTVADVTYEEVQDLNGSQVHRLRVQDPLAAVRGFFGGLAGFGTPMLTPDRESEYLIFVDASGIPVGAHVVLDLTVDIDMDTDMPHINYEIRWDYTFSQWGEPVTISPPQVTNGGGFDDFAPPGG
jgi:hypothetical protein